ncbi:hypothetical protein [Streptomyces umbrinus]|uniref:hypothetical protein n=1 Tax=Streptomyces umbrinus TaxID=67370 RepID=UPI00340947EE
MKRMITLSVLALCAAVLSVPSSPSSAAPEELPLGKKYFVVTKGELRTNGKENRRNNRLWLGTYTFDAAGHRVSASLHHWNQDQVSASRKQELKPFGNRESTGRTPGKDCTGPPPNAAAGARLSVRPCEVQTAKGFPGAPQQTLTGTYSITPAAGGGAQTLSIRWSGRGKAPGHPRNESWQLSRFGTDDKLAQLSSEVKHKGPHRPENTYADFTGGFGYGSNTPTNVRVGMDRARSVAGLAYRGWTWTNDVLALETSAFRPDRFRACDDGDCLTHTENASGRTPACTRGTCPAGTADDRSIQYYIAQVGATDRRDSEWHWCTCLRQSESCYSGNSHVQPLLQVLDDAGGFRGWIGVEASFYNRSPNNGFSRHDTLAVLSRMSAPPRAG